MSDPGRKQIAEVMAGGKKTALVVCPGRGSYTKSELGYFSRNHADEGDLLASVDAWRAEAGQTTVSELDGAERYSLATFMRGDNASLLTFACSFADFRALQRDEIDIVAVTGNSMGWYTALACGEALDLADTINLVNSMGNLVHDQQTGGQILFPLTDDEWQPDLERRKSLDDAVARIRERDDCELYQSIVLGGVAVLAGNDKAVELLQQDGPQGPGRFPMRLQNHGAYHSPMMRSISDQGRNILRPERFRAPSVPLIDGRGRIWRPKAADAEAIWDYTLGTQVVETYDFAAAIRVGLREFAPDWIVVLGPGDTLGGSIGQTLVELGWRGIDSKTGFMDIQASEPFVVSLGREEQRALAA